MEECWTAFDAIVTDTRVQGIPTLVLANKMDADGAKRPEEIKEVFNRHVDKLNVSEAAVMPISALKGWVQTIPPCSNAGIGKRAILGVLS